MNELTFKMDVQLDDNENWIPAGTKVKVANVWKQYEGSTPVIITEVMTYNRHPFQLTPTVEYFMDCTFVELS